MNKEKIYRFEDVYLMFHIFVKLPNVLDAAINTKVAVLSVAYFVTWGLCRHYNFYLQYYSADKVYKSPTEM